MDQKTYEAVPIPGAHSSAVPAPAINDTQQAGLSHSEVSPSNPSSIPQPQVVPSDSTSASHPQAPASAPATAPQAQAVPSITGPPSDQKPTTSFPPPPVRKTQDFAADDPSHPVSYIRDPHKLIAYLVPFPKPDFHKGFLHAADGKDVPERFLIYTPPPPPLKKPAEGEKEAKFHKVQRKWQEEVRTAKADDSKVASWKGLKSRATKGINVAMNWTTTSNLDFLNRVPGQQSKSRDPSPTPDKHADDGVHEGDQTKKTVGLEEMVLIYPSTLPGTEMQIREEFVNTMLRSKSKAQRDSVIATGLLPVGFAIDVLATLVWPFGGLAEIDSVWLYSSIRGAKTARSVTKRLNSSEAQSGASSAPNAGLQGENEAKLKLVFTPSPRLDILASYLNAECHKQNPKYFKSGGPAPTETQVLEAIGWSPSQTGETKNWEDEHWETEEVKDDLRSTMHKGAKEWNKWVAKFEKDPEKAMKK